MIFVERSKESTIDRMKTVKNESYNTHNLYQWIKGIIPKINKKYITPFRIMMLHKRTTMNQLLHSGGLNLTYSRFTITFFYCLQFFLCLISNRGKHTLELPPKKNSFPNSSYYGRIVFSEINKEMTQNP